MNLANTQTVEFLSLNETKSFVVTDLKDGLQNGANPRRWLGACVQLVGGVYIPFLPEPRMGDSKHVSRLEVVERQKRYFSREFQRVLRVFAEPRVWRQDLTNEFPFITFDLRFCRGFSEFETNGEDFSSSLWTAILFKTTFPNVGLFRSDINNNNVKYNLNDDDNVRENYFRSGATSREPSFFSSDVTSREPSFFSSDATSREPSFFDSDGTSFADLTSSLKFENSFPSSLDGEQKSDSRFQSKQRSGKIRQLEGVLTEISKRFRALLPSEITVLPIRWFVDETPTSESHRPIVKNNVAFLYPETVGLERGFKHFAEVRRAQIVNISSEKLSSYEEYVKAIEEEKANVVPLSWSENETDLLGVVNAMFSCDDAVVVSIRVQPTLLTRNERKGIIERINVKSIYEHSNSIAFTHSKRNLIKTLQQKRLYQTVVQIGADTQESAQTVANALAAEYSQTKSNKFRKIAHEQNVYDAVVVTPLANSETAVAKFNMNNMEFVLWGGISKKILETSAVSVGLAPDFFDVNNQKVGLTDWFDSNKIMLSSVFLNRDAEMKASLARLRYLTTEKELQYIWRLPVVPPGGYAGIQSRRPNPFEQLPSSTTPNGDSITLGKVQYRGLDSPTDFRVPFAPWLPEQKVAGVAGIGDKLSVVAGSPGSGKTNFCLGFLRQIWYDRTFNGEEDYRCPYLVIDPTRGNEFRSLMVKKATQESVEYDSDTLVFTVGDSRCSPFCFNPFLVPQGVCVQSHISRLMSCFRAAYEMWDPLPAIFEMALRLAYEGVRKIWWEKKERRKRELEKDDSAPIPEWTPALDFACLPGEVGYEDEAFPTLDTVVKAMGQGKEDDSSELNFMGTGKNTIMREQKEMWGGTTENAHTIVASTFLRLKTIQDNYGHIIGGEAPGRPCIDLRKLMQKPAVLEFGMIGDSQALALIMSFLVSSLVGVIEGRGTPKQGKRHLLVLEEAHRLLEGGSSSQHGSNSKAQAAEDINNMLAEVRKYGQGVMIIDQRPGSLVGGVIDNAFLVVLHRLNEEKGFNQFANQLNLNDDQQKFARAELQPGQMIVLDRRSGCPVLLRPENANTDGEKMSDALLSELMKTRVKSTLLTPRRSCVEEAIPSEDTSNRSERAKNPSTTETRSTPKATPEVLRVVKSFRAFKAKPSEETANKFKKDAEKFKENFPLDREARASSWERVAWHIVGNYNDSGEFSEKDVKELRSFASR